MLFLSNQQMMAPGSACVLTPSSSGEWLCSLCCNLSESETVKKEPGSDGGFQPVDKRVGFLLLTQQ